MRDAWRPRGSAAALPSAPPRRTRTLGPREKVFHAHEAVRRAESLPQPWHTTAPVAPGASLPSNADHSPSQSFKAGGALSSSVELPNCLPEPSVPTAATNLGELNPEQRRGKTNTLANRVAYLIANGADPGRRLLMTFSRQAAAEMADQVPRLVGELGKESLALERNARGNFPRHRLSFARICRANMVRAAIASPCTHVP
jgi:hypothetical protein